LNANVNAKSAVAIYLVGSDCKPTLDGMVIRRDEKSRWRTLFSADGFKRSNGTKVTDKELEALLYVKGRRRGNAALVSDFEHSGRESSE
jgi:Xaa-Pro aminopeptidase